MITLPLERTIEQGAIAKNLGFAQNKLFASTNQAIDFWLEALKKRDNLPRKEYSEYLDSFGYSNRDASPYIKMADFIRTNLMDFRDAIARLDIRVLIKLPRIRYAPIVEAIKEYAPTQKQVNELIKKLPTKPRGYKSAEQRQDEVFELNVPAATGAVIDEVSELSGISKQNVILMGVEILKAIATDGENLAEVIQAFQERIVRRQASDEIQDSSPDDVVDEQELAQQELDAYIEEQQPEIPPNDQTTAPFDFAKNRIAELTTRLQKVETAIALLIEEGHEEESLPLTAARRGREAIVQELDIWGGGDRKTTP